MIKKKINNMKQILTETEAIEICKHLKIVNSPVNFIIANSERFIKLYDIIRFELSTDFDSAYKRDKINYCYSPDSTWDPGR